MQRLTKTAALMFIATAATSEQLEDEIQLGQCDVDHVQAQSPDPAASPDDFLANWSASVVKPTPALKLMIMVVTLVVMLPQGHAW